MASVEYKDIRTATSDGTSVTVDRPDVATGDYLVIVACSAFSAVPVVPAGFTVVARSSSYGQGVICVARYGHDTSDSSFTLTGYDSTAPISCICVSVTGDFSTAPYLYGEFVGKPAGSTTYNGAPISPVDEGDYYSLTGATLYATTGSFTISSSGWTEVFQYSTASGRDHAAIYASKAYEAVTELPGCVYVGSVDARGNMWTFGIGLPPVTGPSFTRDGVEGASIGSVDGIEAASIAEVDGVPA